jgi:hypothetical protein
MVTVLLNVVIMFVVNWSIVAIAVYVDSKWISMNLQIFLALWNNSYSTPWHTDSGYHTTQQRRGRVTEATSE